MRLKFQLNPLQLGYFKRQLAVISRFHSSVRFAFTKTRMDIIIDEDMSSVGYIITRISVEDGVPTSLSHSSVAPDGSFFTQYVCESKNVDSAIQLEVDLAAFNAVLKPCNNVPVTVKLAKVDQGIVLNASYTNQLLMQVSLDTPVAVTQPSESFPDQHMQFFRYTLPNLNLLHAVVEKMVLFAKEVVVTIHFPPSHDMTALARDYRRALANNTTPTHCSVADCVLELAVDGVAGRIASTFPHIKCQVFPDYLAQVDTEEAHHDVYDTRNATVPSHTHAHTHHSLTVRATDLFKLLAFKSIGDSRNSNSMTPYMDESVTTTMLHLERSLGFFTVTQRAAKSKVFLPVVIDPQ